MRHIKGKKYIGSLKCTKRLNAGPFSKGKYYDCYEEQGNTVWVVSYWLFRGNSEGYRFYNGRIPLMTNNLPIFIDYFDTVPLERKLKLKRINDKKLNETH